MDHASGGPQEPQQPDNAQGTPRCYRHPDRETGISCTRCERPICPDCMVSASVGFQCPDCARGTGPGDSGRPTPAATRPRTVAGGSLASDPRLVTKILLGLNIALFIVIHVVPDQTRLLNQLVLLGQWPPKSALVGTGIEPTSGVATGEWYRLVTSMFLHQEIWHIGFNLLSLWWLGGPLEAALGRARFLTLYLLAGLGGGALTYLVASPEEASLGASGAIFGLLAATAVLMRRLNYDMRPVVALVALNLVFTFVWSGIAWQAHIGGLVVGAGVAYAMVHAPRARRSLIQWGTSGAVLLVILVAVAIRTVVLA
ncbi:rhomboid family intramembrane serine protease [Streptomyces tsukubensis]|uniref:Rhomboid family intramembrane serine protease n=1 Tax=Streptomyces tsukubensis TaxID=83656 RepID=A0A1V4A1W6_9ACTN|nr:rhomboid family intramembrane serine protease [Streptomyces tsukubensis]OON73277.1 rhomboid family intramembrane serine protease [Streptomyces tsukubensis]QFR94526.1 rhomboid family intramembrane serine protease [Streptomyces tsukubensis]